MSLRQSEQSGADFSEVSEECETCERETPHEITLELRTENPNSNFSREPYRVAECTVCGETTTRRMNNA
jgi:hypothetical protein